MPEENWGGIRLLCSFGRGVRLVVVQGWNEGGGARRGPGPPEADRSDGSLVWVTAEREPIASRDACATNYGKRDARPTIRRSGWRGEGSTAWGHAAYNGGDGGDG